LSVSFWPLTKAKSFPVLLGLILAVLIWLAGFAALHVLAAN
jgi:hypothetical protein